MQEEKQLLLKDLCSRLPYGVKVRISSESEYCLHEKTTTLDIDTLHKFILDGGYYVRGLLYKTPNFQLLPYLRLISSMTEEEENEFISLNTIPSSCQLPNHTRMNWYSNATMLDWLNAHHFDYRGLIKKGLALEAAKDMYKKI